MKKSIKENKNSMIVDLDNDVYLDKNGINGDFAKESHIEYINNKTILWGKSWANEWGFVVTDVTKGIGDIIYYEDGFTKKNDFTNALMNYKTIHESKNNKTMKKNRMTERFNPPKDWDFEDMLDIYGEEYINEIGYDWEDYVHNMDDLEYYLEKEDLNWLLKRMYYGGQYINGNFNTKETFDPNEEYYVVNGYGNFYSLSEYYKNDFIKDKIEELNNGEESFYDWCVEQGYFKSDEDDE